MQQSVLERGSLPVPERVGESAPIVPEPLRRADTGTEIVPKKAMIDIELLLQRRLRKQLDED